MQKSLPMSLFPPQGTKRAWLAETGRVSCVVITAPLIDILQRSSHKSHRSFTLLLCTHTLTYTHISSRIYTVEMTNAWIYTEQRQKRERAWEREYYDRVKFNLKVPLETQLASHMQEKEWLCSLIYRELRPWRHSMVRCSASVLQCSLVEPVWDDWMSTGWILLTLLIPWLFI